MTGSDPQAAAVLHPFLLSAIHVLLHMPLPKTFETLAHVLDRVTFSPYPLYVCEDILSSWARLEILGLLEMLGLNP